MRMNERDGHLGLVSELDDLGRVQIPLMVRTQYGLHIGDSVAIKCMADGILLARSGSSVPIRIQLGNLASDVENDQDLPLDVKRTALDALSEIGGLLRYDGSYGEKAGGPDD